MKYLIEANKKLAEDYSQAEMNKRRTATISDGDGKPFVARYWWSTISHIDNRGAVVIEDSDISSLPVDDQLVLKTEQQMKNDGWF